MIFHGAKYNPYYWYLRPEFFWYHSPRRCACCEGHSSFGVKWLWFGAFVSVLHSHWLARLFRLHLREGTKEKAARLRRPEKRTAER